MATLPLPAHHRQVVEAIDRAMAAAHDLRMLVEQGVSDAAVPYWAHVLSACPEYNQLQDRLEAHKLMHRIRAVKSILDDAEVALAYRSCYVPLAFLHDAVEYLRLHQDRGADTGGDHGER